MTNTRHSPRFWTLATAFACALASGSFVRAQSTAVPAPNPASDNDDDAVLLSPFVVNAAEDAEGYRATSTLAGTRVRTDLKDVASSLSVVTGKFLRDVGATNSGTLLQYTTNTEVGGIYGNFAGVGSTFTEGASENFAPPHLNTRVRGLDSADNTRDYFRSDIPWDSYNVGRIDIQRGPNSILFGIGSPAGIINASLNTAGFTNSYVIENRVASYGTVRGSADFNQVLIDRELAVRLSLLDDRTKYRQEPAHSDDRRLYGALTWEPGFLRRGSAHTSLRANFERGIVKSNYPRVLTPVDEITPFFDADGMNRTALDPYYAWVAGLVQSSGNTVAPGERPNFWLNQNFGGSAIGTGAGFRYSAGAGGAATIAQASGGAPGGSGAITKFGVSPAGTLDAQINGYPYAGAIGLGNYNQYTIAANQRDATLFPGASSGFYKSRTLSDPAIFDFYNHLIDGPNKREWQNWTAYSFTLDQTFLDNRLGFQVAYDRQSYRQGGEHPVANLIAVDIQANVNSLPWAYGGVTRYNGTGQAGTNANAGRAYVSGSGASAASAQDSEREALRLTATGELRGTDLFRRSLMTDIIGRHVFTGLYSQDSFRQTQRTWDLYAMDAGWDAAMSTGPAADGSGLAPISTNSRSISWIAYLSDPLFGVASAPEARLQPLTSEIAPAGTANVQRFDSHWKPSTNPSDPTYVDPAAPWTNPTVLGGTQVSTQSENPANYVGWRTESFDILSARQGDIESLYRQASKLRQDISSAGLTWQGFLWDDTVAATFGWRRDVQTQRSGNASMNAITGAADMNFDLSPTASKSRGISRSWGVVLHQPKAWRDRLPWGTNFSLIYDHGENARVESRYGFEGAALPNSKGETNDYGFSVSTLDDKLELKVIWYKTTVSNANLSSVMSSESTLGSNAYYQWMLPAWGLGDALQAVAGMAGDPAAAGSAYNWNWAAAAHPGDATYQDVTTSAFKNDPVTTKEKAVVESFLSQLPEFFPQAWWDAFGYPVNVAEASKGNYASAVSGWTVAQGNWAISPSGGGRVNGVPPVGTVDYVSKGVEFELVGRPTKNWNIAVNASKQNAYQSALGQQLVDFISKEEAFYRSAAGDLRLWSAGDRTIGQYFEQNVGAAFRFQQQTNGKMTPEMAPWRVNAVTTYALDHGLLKGAYAGLGYRWEDGHILGYALNDAKDNLDVDRPYWTGSKSHLDLWVGYERKFAHKVNWRIQLNLRNAGKQARLEALSVQPDGTPAAYRIEDGMTWSLTNTFTF